MIIIVRCNYSRGIMPKRVTNDGVYLSGLAPGQHSSEKTWQRWRVVGNNVNLTVPEIKPQTFRTDIITVTISGRFFLKITLQTKKASGKFSYSYFCA